MSSSQMQSATAEHPVSWWKLPWALLWLLPALSVIAGLITVFIAVRHGDSMVKDDYYREGLAYNAQQQADIVAAKLNLHAQLVPMQQQLLVTVSAEQLPELPAQLQLSLSHPTDSALDQRIVLQHQQGQQYAAALQLPLNVLWHVQLQPENSAWRLRGRWQTAAPAQLRPEVL